MYGDVSQTRATSSLLWPSSEVGAHQTPAPLQMNDKVTSQAHKACVSSKFTDAAKALLSSPLPPELIVDFKGKSFIVGQIIYVNRRRMRALFILVLTNLFDQFFSIFPKKRYGTVKNQACLSKQVHRYFHRRCATRHQRVASMLSTATTHGWAVFRFAGRSVMGLVRATFAANSSQRIPVMTRITSAPTAIRHFPRNSKMLTFLTVWIRQYEDLLLTRRIAPSRFTKTCPAPCPILSLPSSASTSVL